MYGLSFYRSRALQVWHSYSFLPQRPPRMSRLGRSSITLIPPPLIPVKLLVADEPSENSESTNSLRLPPGNQTWRPASSRNLRVPRGKTAVIAGWWFARTIGFIADQTYFTSIEFLSLKLTPSPLVPKLTGPSSCGATFAARNTFTNRRKS
jgi:hypothetical protein